MNNTLLQIFTVLHYFGELIAIGMRQDMVDATVDSILVKEGRVEITFLFHSNYLILQWCFYKKKQDSIHIKNMLSLIRVFAVRMKKYWVLSFLLRALRRLWPGWTDAQADLSLRWAHRSFCWFCHGTTQILLLDGQTDGRQKSPNKKCSCGLLVNQYTKRQIPCSSNFRYILPTIYKCRIFQSAVNSVKMLWNVLAT